MSRRKRLRKEKAQKVKEPKGVSEESKKELEVREGSPSPVGNENHNVILNNRDFIDTMELIGLDNHSTMVPFCKFHGVHKSRKIQQSRLMPLLESIKRKRLQR